MKLCKLFAVVAITLSPTFALAARATGERVPLNLALGKAASASGSQGGNDPAHAVDGDPGTRWCAPGASAEYSWQFDLGQPEDVTSCRIEWEYDARYRYKLESSPDGKAWSVLADHTAADIPAKREHEHKLDAKAVCFVRITVTGLDEGRWASIREVELYGSKMTDAKGAATKKNDRMLAEIKAPSGLKLTMFAAPPDVSYPVCLATSPAGDVFVAVDPNGSLDQKAGRGKIIRCRDTNGDGVADEFKTFASLDSPRGMVWDAATNTMFVQHPPFVRMYFDDNGDGVADRDHVLVEGLGFDLGFRGADHTTNGMQMGIDGWLYVAVGDYGFVNAKARGGKSHQLYGGGVVRVRRDGSQLEIVSRGQRNIYDVAVSPRLDLFTRDNTNDGDGWDVRLSHVVQTGQYGYPTLFKNFPDEIVQPLAIYGGGSPTGSIYLDEPALPSNLGRGLYTCDWGKSKIYRHDLEPSGATFTAKQEVFVDMPRPVDMEVDAAGNLYLASWRGGGFAYTGPDVGYVARLANPDGKPPALPDLKRADADALLAELATDSHTRRLAAQHEILRRGVNAGIIGKLRAAATAGTPIESRVAAVFTLAQVKGLDAARELASLVGVDDVREFALRALADHALAADPAQVDAKPFVAALADENPRVRFQAVVSLGRLGKTDAAAALVPLVRDPDRMVAHAAVNALVALRAVDPCFAALDAAETPFGVGGIARVLQSQHDPRVVDGLIARLNDPRRAAVRQPILMALCRLYTREHDWTQGWWGTRPDTSGPYYHPVQWSESGKILDALRGALNTADGETLPSLLVELQRHKVELPEATAKLLELARRDKKFQGIAADLLVARKDLPADAINLLAETASSAKQDGGVRVRALGALARSAQPEAIDAAVGVFAALGGDDAADWLRQLREEFLRDPQHNRRVDLFAKLAGAAASDPARKGIAFGVLAQVASSKQSPKDAAQAARQAIATAAGAGDKTAVEVLAKLDGAKPQAADPDKVLIANLPYEKTLEAALKHEGEASAGATLFVQQGCVACHTVSQNEPPKGPYLGGIAKRYSRGELIESILKPNAKITQGFVTHYFVTKKRERVDGFVVREAGDEVEVRTAAGTPVVIKNADVARKGTLKTSIMPEELVNNLSPEELSSLLAYLESLKAD